MSSLGETPYVQAMDGMYRPRHKEQGDYGDVGG